MCHDFIISQQSDCKGFESLGKSIKTIILVWLLDATVFIPTSVTTLVLTSSSLLYLTEPCIRLWDVRLTTNKAVKLFRLIRVRD